MNQEKKNKLITTTIGDRKLTAEEENLLAPYYYITQIPENGLREKLLKAFNKWFEIPMEQFDKICEIIRFAHVSIVMIQDIQDDYKLRRGIPTAHNVFGIATTLNTIVYIMCVCIKETLKVATIKGTSIFFEYSIEILKAQNAELYWRENYICPSEEEYKVIAERKTGSMFNLGMELMRLFSEKKRDVSKICNLIGQYFQIRDDYLNLKSKQCFEKKGYCEDLEVGKFTFPVIHYITNNPGNMVLHQILKKRSSDEEIKKFAVDLMEKFGSFEYTLQVLDGLKKDIREELENHGGNDDIMKIIEELDMSKDF